MISLALVGVGLLYVLHLLGKERDARIAAESEHRQTRLNALSDLIHIRGCIERGETFNATESIKYSIQCLQGESK